MLRAAVEALLRNRLRTLLTALGLVIGTASVLATIAIGDGARARVAEQIRALGSNLIVVTPGNARSGGARLAAGSGHGLTIDDGAAIAGEIAAVELAAPVVHGVVQAVAANANWSTTLIGADADFLVAREWPLDTGRVFSAEEMAGAAKVAILGATVAEKLFGQADPIDATIRVGTMPLRVVGILAGKGQDTQGVNQDDLLVVPLATARTRILGGLHATARSVAFLLVKVRPGEDLAGVEAEVGDVLRQRHRRVGDDESDFSILNYAETIARQDAAARTVALLLSAVAGISLLVGGIGVMNVMLFSVTERTREIGVRLAIGARPRDVLAQFLVEAAMLSGMGAVAGAALGIAATLGLAALAGWPAAIRPEAILIAGAASLLTGTAFGLYPARRAAGSPPAVALRCE